MKNNLVWFLNGILIAAVVGLSIGATRGSGGGKYSMMLKANGYVVLDKEKGDSNIIFYHTGSGGHKQESYKFTKVK